MLEPNESVVIMFVVVTLQTTNNNFFSTTHSLFILFPFRIICKGKPAKLILFFVPLFLLLYINYHNIHSIYTMSL